MSFGDDPENDRVIWDYALHGGPYCTEHRSSQCSHVLAVIERREDVGHLEVFLNNAPRGHRFKVLVPLWAAFFMWEDLQFEIVYDEAMGAYGKLIDRGQFATYDWSVTRLLRGESAYDLGATMVQQFVDIMDFDRPARLPGCKSGAHTFAYQKSIEALSAKADSDEVAASRLMPHLYSLIGRTKPICAFCWADSYGSDARRVSGIVKEQAKVDDFEDLLFQG